MIGSSRRCAYLTMDDLADFVTDADLSLGPMADLGWTVEFVSWRDRTTDWDDYDAVYICTPWDYPDDPDRFFETLGAIDASSALLVNSLELVRWNLDKTYLKDIEARGGDIVPSLWLDRPGPGDLREAAAAFDGGAIVVKPVIGANAVDTFVVPAEARDNELAKVAEVFAMRRCIVQPFIANIATEGEYSLFFLAGEYSHAIRKVPRAGDFRVQEEHGAEISSVPAPAALLEAGEKIMGLVEPQPVYARADFVREPDGLFLLMELELIEPSLYLRTDSGAPERFARAFDRHWRSSRAA